jgi:hypothetical protein
VDSEPNDGRAGDDKTGCMNRTPKGEARKDPPFFAVDAAEAAAIERRYPLTDEEL